jgi:hypothetical protein
MHGAAMAAEELQKLQKGSDATKAKFDPQHFSEEDMAKMMTRNTSLQRQRRIEHDRWLRKMSFMENAMRFRRALKLKLSHKKKKEKVPVPRKKLLEKIQKETYEMNLLKLLEKVKSEEWPDGSRVVRVSKAGRGRLGASPSRSL